MRNGVQSVLETQIEYRIFSIWNCVKTIDVLESLMLSSSPQNRVICQQCLQVITYLTALEEKRKARKNKKK